MNEIIIQTPDAASLQEQIIQTIKRGKFKSWKVEHENDTNYLIHNSQWGKKAFLTMEIEPNQPKELNVRTNKFPHVKKELSAISGNYLSRFCQILFSDFEEDFISILPVKQ